MRITREWEDAASRRGLLGKKPNQRKFRGWNRLPLLGSGGVGRIAESHLAVLGRHENSEHGSDWDSIPPWYCGFSA